jgi:hypothetical protein
MKVFQRMKKSFFTAQRNGFSSWILSLALIVSSFAAESAPPGVSLLRDGGFEAGTNQLTACPKVRGTLPVTWSDNSCWHPSVNVTYDVVASPSRDGHGVQVSLQSGLFQLVQAVQLQPDWQFTLGTWVRSAAPMLVKVALRQSGPPYLEYGARYIRTSDQWSFVSVSAFSHGLSEQDARQALFLISSATPGTLWLDDAVLMGGRAILSLPKGEVPAEYFGTHVLHTRNAGAAFDQSAAGSVRIWDSEQAQWHQVQGRKPKGGKRRYVWDSLDQRIGVADEHRADVLMVLGGYAPAWASMDEDAEEETWPDCYRCDESPRRMSDWQNWTLDLAARYKGRAIKSWEIWNEPYFPAAHEWCPDAVACRSGLGAGYKGTPEQLLQLQTEAEKVLKRLDSQARVVSPGISYLHREYLDYYLRIGGGKVSDAIGYHFYLEGYPELMLPHALAIRAIMKDHGVADKPLWSTESAIGQISLDVDPANRYAQALGGSGPSVEDLSPAYLARFMIVGWAAGIGRIYQYAWDDQHGWPSSPTFVNKRTNNVIGVNDTGAAFRQVRSWMTGRRLLALESGQSSGLWQATLQDSSGRMSYLVWHPARTPALPAALKVPTGVNKVCDLSGTCRMLEVGAKLAIDFRPVFLTQ